MGVIGFSIRMFVCTCMSVVVLTVHILHEKVICILSYAYLFIIILRYETHSTGNNIIDFWLSNLVSLFSSKLLIVQPFVPCVIPVYHTISDKAVVPMCEHAEFCNITVLNWYVQLLPKRKGETV